MKRRPAWFYEWTTYWRGEPRILRAVWVPPTHRQATGYRRQLASIVVRWRHVRLYSRHSTPPFIRRTGRSYWGTYAWIPRADVEAAVRARIPCRLLLDGTRCRTVAIDISLSHGEAMLVALDAWLEAGETTT